MGTLDSRRLWRVRFAGACARKPRFVFGRREGRHPVEHPAARGELVGHGVERQAGHLRADCSHCPIVADCGYSLLASARASGVRWFCCSELFGHGVERQARFLRANCSRVVYFSTLVLFPLLKCGSVVAW